MNSTLKNKNISGLFNFLSALPLGLEESSARRRFLRHIKGFKEDFDLEAEEIRKEFSEKNADGSNKVVNNLVQFTLPNRKLADVKMLTLNNLEIPIDWGNETIDKSTMISIIEKKITELKSVSEFTDSAFAYVEELEEMVAELN